MESINHQAQRVLDCVRHNKLYKAKTTLKGKNKQDIVNRNWSGHTALTLAAQLGHVRFVNYLLDECGADIEQRGLYEIVEDNERHQVSFSVRNVKKRKSRSFSLDRQYLLHWILQSCC